MGIPDFQRKIQGRVERQGRFRWWLLDIQAHRFKLYEGLCGAMAGKLDILADLNPLHG